MKKNKIIEIALHLFFWISYVGIYTVMYDDDQTTIIESFLIILSDLPLKILLVYFFMFIVLPKSIKAKSIKVFIWYFIISLPLVIFIKGLTLQYIVYPYFAPERMDIKFWTLSRIFKIFILLYGLTFSAVAIYYAFILLKRQKESFEIESQKLKEELKFLKNQINPHFLFNTLNNLYSLILNENPKAKDVVLKLSELLNYMLYETTENTVVIAKEIEYIKNYLMLEKIRYGDRIDVSFNHSNIEKSIKIPSLITLPIIENCFKHGVTNESEKAYISIEISYSKGEFTLKTENTKPKIKIDSKNNGIGLNNLNRRLELILEKKYFLKVIEDEDSYMSILKFNPESIKRTL